VENLHCFFQISNSQTYYFLPFDFYQSSTVSVIFLWHNDRDFSNLLKKGNHYGKTYILSFDRTSKWNVFPRSTLYLSYLFLSNATCARPPPLLSPRAQRERGRKKSLDQLRRECLSTRNADGRNSDFLCAELARAHLHLTGARGGGRKIEKRDDWEPLVGGQLRSANASAVGCAGTRSRILMLISTPVRAPVRECS